ncbi:M48 family metallopeptidase [Candidatus Bathyarchaeota archaeon]|nr:M48 family metallopeptidase [Candidatus Bathyarchaeota archaeon]
MDGLKTLKALAPVTSFLKDSIIKDIERSLLKQVSTLLDAENSPRLRRLIRECARILCLNRLPKVFVRPSNVLNAFTFGTDERATVVINSLALKVLTDDELKVLVSHEFAHVKSEHMLYHTLAEYLAGGITLSASILGFGPVATPIRLALLSWYRNSEVTADRASVLVVNDLNVVKSFFAKLVFFSGNFKKEVDFSENGLMGSFLELLKTHPLYKNRIERITEFYNSKRFAAVRRKIDLRERRLTALSTRCRFCGARKPVTAIFCPECGRCQI